MLDVESEFKGHPEAAADVCQRIRETLGSDYPMLLQQLLHRALPSVVPIRNSPETVPQVYWNGFRWPLERVLGWTYDDYAGMSA